ncbi:hypothetical protein GCM10023144_14920 [Pigmentiphaga soli]|uniref:Cellulose synthase operon C C-terminal domain-containing protein n=1 Tax=Pigmentiphaga soli TaxID=1007095 RepID=A0ABP8GS25_9BURK
MSARHNTLVLGLLAALIQNTALAQSDPVKVLIEQGQYWQSRGDGTRAAEAWQKLLSLKPNQPEALYGLGLIEIDEGRPDNARSYLAQLKRSSPNSPYVARLEQSINLGSNAGLLAQARQLARSGRTAEAVETYQSALGGKAPTGPVALEYYQTLGGTPQGWEEARAGLEKLAKESPNDPQIALALAQHLTYRESTRREGIEQLARLASRADVGKAATDSWRKALAWIGTRPSDAPLYQAYLKLHPDDTGIRTRLDEIGRQAQESRRAIEASSDPLRQRTAAGFKALDNGDLDAAAADFQAVLAARPNDGDALGGLGVLRLRQENFAEAKDLLERASRQGAASRWRTALNSATYWTLVRQAEGYRSGGNLDAARQALEQAVKIDPDEPTAQNALGDVLVATGQLDAAEATYRRVLDKQADNPDAIRGLVGVMSQNNKPDQALALIDRLTPQQQEQIGELGRLRAAQAVGMAKAAAQRGDDAGARVHLEEALLNDPTSPWIRLDLARLYMKVGAYNDARGVMDGLLVSNPNMPEALYASALLAAEMKDWRGALDTLNRIPPQNRTRDMATLQRRAWVHAQSDLASSLAKDGRTQEAIAMLTQAQGYAGQDPELLGAVAMAYTDAGDTNRALAMIRQLMTRSTQPDVGIRLQYAAILLKTRQDVELAGVLRQMQSMAMSPSERQSFNDLRQAYIVRQADALRESGDLVAAYDVLAPLLAERPNEPAVVGALARMYGAAGDYSQALSLYNRLLQQDPNNVETLLAAASVATSGKQYDYAESAINTALARAPRDSQVLAAAGRLYRAQGKTAKAEQYLGAAVALENAQRGVPPPGAAMAPQAPGARAPSANPFVGRPGQRSFSTLQPQQQPMVYGTPPAQAYPVAAPATMSAAQLRSYYLPVAAQAEPVQVAQAYIPPPAGAAMFPPPAPDYAQAAATQQGYTPYAAPQAAPGGYAAGQGGYPPPAGYPTAPGASAQAGYPPAQGYGVQQGYPPGAPQPQGTAPGYPAQGYDPQQQPYGGYPPPSAYYQDPYAAQQAAQQPAPQQPQASAQRPGAQAASGTGAAAGRSASTAAGRGQPAARSTASSQASRSGSAARNAQNASTRNGPAQQANAAPTAGVGAYAPPNASVPGNSYIPAPVQPVPPQTYAQQPYPYPQPYGAPAYPQAGYPQAGYPQTAYPQAAYPQTAYSPPAYPPAQYPPAAYAQPAYPQPSYSQPSYPQQAYAQPAPAYGAQQTAAAVPPPWETQATGPRTVRDELIEVQQQRAPVLSVGGTARNRQGEAGLSELTDLQAPVEYRFPAGDGKIALRVTPVSLDAGTPDSNYNTSSRFGGGPVAALAQAAGSTGGAGSQDQTGVGLGVAYETSNLQADLGTSPLGFRYTDVNGGVKFRGDLSDTFSYTADLSRRPVTDSLLSFAGARDARTGQEWGGVSATGGRLEVGWDNGQYGIYGYGSFHALTGTNVESNTRIEGGGGLYWRLLRTLDSEMTAGVNFTGISYDKNLRYFTYGHGGYFSPQQFFAVSVPLSWTQRSGRLSYQVKGSLGVQSFREDSAPYFPTSSSMQSAAQQAATDAANFGLTTNARAVYPGQDKTGLGYNLAAALEYQAAPQLFIGGQLAMDNASDYRQLVGGVYLRYALQPYTGQMAMPVNPFRSTYPY